MLINFDEITIINYCLYHSHGSIKVIHCRTEYMNADGFTKPLQCVAFIRFRNYVLGIDDTNV